MRSYYSPKVKRAMPEEWVTSDNLLAALRQIRDKLPAGRRQRAAGQLIHIMSDQDMMKVARNLVDSYALVVRLQETAL